MKSSSRKSPFNLLKCVTVAGITACLALSATLHAEDDPAETTEALPVLRVGVSATYAPVIYKQGDHIFGIEADNARGVAEALEHTLEFVELGSSDELIEAVNAGSIDVIMSGMTVTKERSEKVLFSDSFVTVPLGVLVKAKDKANYEIGRDVRSANTAIGVKEGTTGHDYAQVYCYGGREKIKFITQKEAANAVLKGKIGFFIHDLPSVRFIASEYEGELDFLDFDLQPQRLAWAVSLENKSLLKDLNKILKGWRKDGQLEEHVGRWLPDLGDGVEQQDRVGRQRPFTAVNIKSKQGMGVIGTVVIDGIESTTREIDISHPHWEMFYLEPGEHELSFSAKGFKTSTHKIASKANKPMWNLLKINK